MCMSIYDLMLSLKIAHGRSIIVLRFVEYRMMMPDRLSYLSTRQWGKDRAPTWMFSSVASSRVYLCFTHRQSLLHLGGSNHHVAPTFPLSRFTATDVSLHRRCSLFHYRDVAARHRRLQGNRSSRRFARPVRIAIRSNAIIG